MRRRQRSPFGTRTRKVRPAITVKEKPAPRKGRCTACRMDILKGETAVYVRVRTRRFHKGCAPANVGAPPPQQGAPAAMPSDATEAKQFAMLALENAMLAIAKRAGFPKELEDAFTKYQKIKEHAIRPGNENEGAVAMKMALLAVIKATF
jgi:hypothetical protein